MADQTVLDLGQKVKAKYPGEYDDIEDAELGRRVKAKHPEYADFADVQLPGALSQIGTSIGNAITGLAKTGFAVSPLGMASEAAGFGNGPQALVKGLYDAQADQARQAQEKLKAGNYLGGAESMLGAAVPLAGPFIQNTAQKLSTPGQRVEGATDIALQALPFAAPKILGALGKVPPVTGGAGRFQFTGGVGTIPDRMAIAATDPIPEMVRAIKPKNSAFGFDKTLANRAAPEIKGAEVQSGVPIGAKEGTPYAYPGHVVDDVLDNIKAAKASLWDKIRQHMGPQAAMGTEIDLTPLAAATKKSIPAQIRILQPEVAKQMEQEADSLYAGKKVSVPEAEDLLQGFNAKLDSYYAKFPGARRASLAANPDMAHIYSSAEALRKGLYDKLEENTGSPAVRDYKKRYGALSQVEENLQPRRNVAARQNPNSLTEQVGSVSAAGDVASGLGKTAAAIFSGHPGAALGATQDFLSAMGKREASQWLRDANTTDTMLRRAFTKYDTLPTYYPPPMPFVPAGLLERGAIQMPGGPDTSGPIPPTLPRGERVVLPSSRQLAAPTIKLPGRAPGLNASGQDVTGERGMSPEIQPRMTVSPDQVASLAQANNITFDQAVLHLQQQGYRMWTPSYPISLNPPPMPPR